MAKPCTTDKEWLVRIQSWKESGLSQSAWCQKHDIRVSKFGYWKRKLETVSPAKPANKTGFVPVVSAQQPVSPNDKSGLTVALPNGVTLSGINESNLSLVKQLIGGML
ncbi:MAG: hypothetical protein OXC41_00025 [Gammaproteobacteria bacterium]|nr:hypothetical protein [Gammaproteobacteria bacterium]